MRLNILVGGKAGQGPNILAEVLSRALVSEGYNVFYSRDYQSLIRGGHNFNVVTFSDEVVFSNDSKIDLIVALDEQTEKIHKNELKKGGMIIRNGGENMYFAGRLFKAIGLSFDVLDSELKKLKKRYKENIILAKKGYSEGKECKLCGAMAASKKSKSFMSGSKGIAEGAVKSGLDVYYAYPMTPATPLLNELASCQEKDNFLTIELENEISVVNATIGSAITGAKAMAGSSGGGFDLMTEAVSMAGMAEVPLVLYLAQRPGPGSGVPTYTMQGDLQMARHSGHGEFNRVLLAPGDPVECQEKVSEAFYFSQKFKIPTIVISDKHLAESSFTFLEKPKITKSVKLTRLQKYNSYEHNVQGIATDDAEGIKKSVERRLKTRKEIIKEAKKFQMYKLHGRKTSKNLVVGWGSTKGAILDALNGVNAGFLQILYIEPFPDISRLLKGKNVILIENNATGQLGEVIAEKTGISIDQKILRYDSRPFLADELKEEIKKLI